MDMIRVDLSKEEYFIKEGAEIRLGAYIFHFSGGMLFIEEFEVFAGKVWKPFPVQIFRMAMENPDVAWSIIYPTKEGE